MLTPVEAPVAILHLTAIVAVLTWAYVGVDRAGGAEDPMGEGFENVRGLADGIKKQFELQGIVGEKMKSSRFLAVLFPAYVIILIAGHEVTLRQPYKAAFYIYRQRHVAFLKYFRDRTNVGVVGLMALISTALLFAVVHAIVWDEPWIKYPGPEHAIYRLLSAMVAWVFMTGFLALGLRKDRLEKRCHQLHDLVKRRLAAARSDAMQILEDFTASEPR